jgi:Double-GTPase 1
MQRTILIFGEPETGKSNYIGRSWLAVDGGLSSLSIRGLPEDLDTVRFLSSALLEGNYSGHTNPNSAATVLLDVLENGPTEKSLGQIALPDFKGENAMRIYKSRQWLPGWGLLLDSLHGWLIFVRGEKIRAEIDWAKAQELGGSYLREHQTPLTDPCTDVLLVEMNQLLMDEIEARSVRSPRIGVVVSCWDELPDGHNQLSPEAYIRQELPLLWQFLKARDSEGEVRFFGLSTTGGDLNNGAFRDQFLNSPDTFGYVRWNGHSGELITSNDMAEPIRWALEG